MNLVPGTTVNLGPRSVEYKWAAGSGFCIVRVMIHGEPRVIAQTEVSRAHAIDITPMSLYLSEILFYIRDAYQRTGIQGGIVPLEIRSLATSILEH